MEVNMKYISLALLFSLPISAFAQKKAEFDENQEKVCYEEARKVGCVKGNEAADIACSKSNKAKLPTKCHQILGIQ